jgi:hypothetical protein
MCFLFMIRARNTYGAVESPRAIADLLARLAEHVEPEDIPFAALPMTVPQRAGNGCTRDGNRGGAQCCAHD